jgi:hypothetical protein
LFLFIYFTQVYDFCIICLRCSYHSRTATGEHAAFAAVLMSNSYMSTRSSIPNNLFFVQWTNKHKRKQGRSKKRKKADQMLTALYERAKDRGRETRSTRGISKKKKEKHRIVCRFFNEMAMVLVEAVLGRLDSSPKDVP